MKLGYGDVADERRVEPRDVGRALGERRGRAATCRGLASTDSAQARDVPAVVGQLAGKPIVVVSTRANRLTMNAR